MRFFFSDAAYAASIEAEVERRLTARLADIISLYSENPDLLRQAVAAYHGLDDWTTIRTDSSLLKPTAQAIRAFGHGLHDLRLERLAGHVGGVPTYLVDGLGQE